MLWNLSRLRLVTDLSTNPNVTVLGARQEAPTSRLIARELGASVKRRAEPEAEAIAAISDLETKAKKKKE